MVCFDQCLCEKSPQTLVRPDVGVIFSCRMAAHEIPGQIRVAVRQMAPFKKFGSAAGCHDKTCRANVSSLKERCLPCRFVPICP